MSLLGCQLGIPKDGETNGSRRSRLFHGCAMGISEKHGSFLMNMTAKNTKHSMTLGLEGDGWLLRGIESDSLALRAA